MVAVAVAVGVSEAVGVHDGVPTAPNSQLVGADVAVAIRSAGRSRR